MCESASSLLPPVQGWRSPDGQLGIIVEPQLVETMLGFCTAAKHRETGGILIGRYGQNLALAEVTRVTGPPTDSRAGRAFFRRGTMGLQQLLDQQWRDEATFYLGEWHFHPGADSTPSSTDHQQMHMIAVSKSFRCPEPILLIIGGQPPTSWTIRVFVYPDGRPMKMKQRGLDAGLI